MTDSDSAASLAAIVLAAGKGTRMKSARFKVLHEIGHLPLIGHSIAAAKAAGAAPVVAVTGPDQDAVRAVLPDDVGTAIQDRALGTGHAVLAAAEFLEGLSGTVIILLGADPMILPDTLRSMKIKREAGAGIVVLGFRAPEPAGLGRLITGPDGSLLKIVEHKDASDAERAIDLCNAGAMALDAGRALTWLNQIGNDNAKGEYYLTDIVGIARQDGARIDYVEASPEEAIGVDTRQDLAAAETVFQHRKRSQLMSAGVTMTAPETVFLAHDTAIGPDSVIEPHVVFGPDVQIANDVTIRAFSHVEGATIAAGVTIGPYARIRPDSVIGEGARIGNFVELKKTDVAPGAKIPHLSYVGDASIGAAANVGAGTITCNYDGFRKSRTEIGEGAFIGSNSALVAPVTIGKGAIVGAGSTVTRDVPAQAIAIARGEQQEKPGGAERFRAKRQSEKGSKKKG